MGERYSDEEKRQPAGGDVAFIRGYKKARSVKTGLNASEANPYRFFLAAGFLAAGFFTALVFALALLLGVGMTRAFSALASFGAMAICKSEREILLQDFSPRP
ncbi:hypothetical protein K0B96_04695 [Horticoccus luteus]|uniref:Uncharacterized protein n=1 Tax=Horticoccus luteus TaxID=2862869 RepID=A0A8F9TVK6_9BACT|nr:hypothetical protein [Horticoccus luteus]QYM79921.1 hypothetical protein K0B96_04695 [Horticoccus luteus]